MKLSRESHSQLEMFFRHYYGDDEFVLPEVHIYCGRFTKLFINVIKVHGITLGRRIYVWPELIKAGSTRGPAIAGSLLAHEVTHVLQYREHGYHRFLFNYLKSYVGNLRVLDKWDLPSRQQAYLDIPFEVEARETADDFAAWARSGGEVSLPLKRRGRIGR